MKNVPSNMMLKATRKEIKPAASTSTLKLGKGCLMSAFNFEVGLLVGAKCCFINNVNNIWQVAGARYQVSGTKDQVQGGANQPLPDSKCCILAKGFRVFGMLCPHS